MPRYATACIGSITRTAMAGVTSRAASSCEITACCSSWPCWPIPPTLHAAGCTQVTRCKGLTMRTTRSRRKAHFTLAPNPSCLHNAMKAQLSFESPELAAARLLVQAWLAAAEQCTPHARAALPEPGPVAIMLFSIDYQLGYCLRGGWACILVHMAPTRAATQAQRKGRPPQQEPRHNMTA